MVRTKIENLYIGAEVVFPDRRIGIIVTLTSIGYDQVEVLLKKEGKEETVNISPNNLEKKVGYRVSQHSRFKVPYIYFVFHSEILPSLEEFQESFTNDRPFNNVRRGTNDGNT